MPWFKVDDKLHDHRKARSAGPAAMGLWVLAGSWSADNLTDGFIPASLLPRWGRQREASRLVDVGLWHADEQDGEKGWRFHEWAERQPTRAQKLAEREAKAEAGRIGGLHSGRSRREASTKQSASPLVELPSRPDPTRKESAGGSESDGPAATPPKQSNKKKPAKPLPEDWAPTQAHFDRCVEAGVDPATELAKFKAHAEANDRRQANWNAAFTQWLLNARPAPSNVRRLPSGEGADDWMRRRPTT